MTQVKVKTRVTGRMTKKMISKVITNLALEAQLVKSQMMRMMIK